MVSAQALEEASSMATRQDDRRFEFSMILEWLFVSVWLVVGLTAFGKGLKDAPREKGGKPLQPTAFPRPRRRRDRRVQDDNRRRRFQDESESAPERWEMKVCPSNPEIGFTTNQHY